MDHSPSPTPSNPFLPLHDPTPSFSIPFHLSLPLPLPPLPFLPINFSFPSQSLSTSPQSLSSLPPLPHPPNSSSPPSPPSPILPSTHLNHLSQPIPTQHSSSSLPPTSSLTRRLVAVARFPGHSDRHASIDQINHLVQAPGHRPQAVNRLRQRINHLRPDHHPHQQQAPHQDSPELDFGTRNLVGTLHQIRSQRHRYPKYLSRHTYLLYCGSHSHVGCGRLLTARATPLLTSRLASPFERPADPELLASDSLPVPGAVDQLDSLTQASLERDLTQTRSQCRCERRFLGCLDCGNTVGHLVSLHCQHCREHAAVFRYRYHLASLTALPRLTGWPIALTLAAVSPTRPIQPVMSWTEALRVHMDDWDAGLVGTGRDQVGVTGLGTSRRGFSTAVRSAIARGMATETGSSLAHARHARLGRSDAIRVSGRRTRVRGSSIPDGREISPPLMQREYVSSLGWVPAGQEVEEMSVEVKEEEEEEDGLGLRSSGLGRRQMDEDEEDRADDDELVGWRRRMRRRIEVEGDEMSENGQGVRREQRVRFVWSGEVCGR